ncbi:ATP-binding protein [Mucilaginibacter sp. SMC90]|uniref:ATP-binding protein n=1 Tax=Mucilaginibacter sp. SMC90 TaxID=2929803 RepID=UPI001FB2428E|nr:ATP-binding protein [Mucilaginibacter sp. SMC90]UOE48503.1 ATP-binding protein [Mucilaginibacter sp. SMC90]
MADSFNETQLPAGTVSAYPTKKFFMSMLTRDIALTDAIMDLLDNCIDGIQRQKKELAIDSQLPYSGFYGEITIDENQFILKDNCGGIPLNTATNYAFKMGRSDSYHDDDNLETVGMYGIGMKRAIFKMGLKAEVVSYHKDDIFKVEIPEDWSSTPDWYFKYNSLTKEDIDEMLSEFGTLIKVTNLHKNIGFQFNDKSGFIKNLAIELRNHYGYLVQQGFRITLNGVNIEPLVLNILTSEDFAEKSIKPYVYSAKIEDITVEVIIGFYRPLANYDEIEAELDGSIAKSLSENAGITVICNDRVVLYCDKTFLTGWGESPVPKYHTQFIAIAGVVHFRSNNPINLPVTTTKRGLDTSSAVYAEVKNKIKDGLKYFTSFTNNWKTPSEQRTKLFEKAVTINALQPGQTKSNLIKLVDAKKGETAQYQIPNLPKPDDAVREKFVTITFNREKTKVDDINNYFLAGQAKSAAEVGGWCFDQLSSQVE